MDGEFDGRAVTRRSKAKYNAKYNSENCFHALPPSVFILSVPFSRVRRVYFLKKMIRINGYLKRYTTRFKIDLTNLGSPYGEVPAQFTGFLCNLTI